MALAAKSSCSNHFIAPLLLGSAPADIKVIVIVDHDLIRSQVRILSVQEQNLYSYIINLKDLDIVDHATSVAAFCCCGKWRQHNLIAT